MKTLILILALCGSAKSATLVTANEVSSDSVNGVGTAQWDYESATITSTPTRIGSILVSTNTGNIYIAVSTAGTFGWTFLKTGNLTAWTATKPSGLTSWYDANNGPTPTTNNTIITAWNDRGTTANNITSLGGAGIVKYYSSIQNGLPAIYCDGASRANGSDKADTAQPITMFLVFKPTNWGTGGYQDIVSMYNGQETMGKYTGGTLPAISAGTWLTTGSISNNTAHIMTAVFNGGSSSVVIDNNTAATGAGGSAANTNSPEICDFGDNSGFYTGYIMEWLVYTGALSTADQTTVRNYLNNKWAIY